MGEGRGGIEAPMHHSTALTALGRGCKTRYPNPPLVHHRPCPTPLPHVRLAEYLTALPHTASQNSSYCYTYIDKHAKSLLSSSRRGPLPRRPRRRPAFAQSTLPAFQPQRLARAEDVLDRSSSADAHPGSSDVLRQRSADARCASRVGILAHDHGSASADMIW